MDCNSAYAGRPCDCFLLAIQGSQTNVKRDRKKKHYFGYAYCLILLQKITVIKFSVFLIGRLVVLGARVAQPPALD